MARTVRNPKLDTRSARARLPMRGSPYWVSLAPGCTLGYRKGPKGGVWLAKIMRDGLRPQTKLGPAADALEPDGLLAVSYAQSQTKARDWFAAVTRGGTPARSLHRSQRASRLSRLVPRHRQKSIKE